MAEVAGGVRCGLQSTLDFVWQHRLMCETKLLTHLKYKQAHGDDNETLLQLRLRLLVFDDIDMTSQTSHQSAEYTAHICDLP